MKRPCTSHRVPAISASRITTVAVMLRPIRTLGLASPVAVGAAAIAGALGFTGASIWVVRRLLLHSFRLEDVVQLETMCQVEYICYRRRVCDETHAVRG